MTPLGAPQCIKTAIYALLQVWIDVELLLVDGFWLRFFHLGLARWSLGWLPLSNLFYLHARIEDIMFGICGQDMRRAVTI